ncbi:MAG: outer membrane protein assembly factor BamE [Proteobacteria bacterium]|nr:outer membrane protein assembly factor BamE [Pseudomonadota bacterium]
MLLRLPAVISVLFLASCGSARLSAPDISPYRMEIQQGNFVSQEMVSQLKIGMSKDQVRFVLGTPLITDSFHADRWDYIFRRQKSGSKQLEHHRLAVFFEDGKLVRTDSDVIPAADVDAAGVKLPEAKPDAPAAKPDTAAAKPEPQKKPVPAAAPETKPAAPAKVEAPKPPPAAEKAAATPEKPAETATPSDDAKPPEKKGWWDKIKDAVKIGN